MENIMALLIDNKEVRIELDNVSEKLMNTTDIQRAFYEISPSGYGIHWPLVDEDLSLDALLNLAEQNEKMQS